MRLGRHITVVVLASKASDTAEWLFAVAGKVCFAFPDVHFCSHREVPAGAVGRRRALALAATPDPVPSGHFQAA